MEKKKREEEETEIEAIAVWQACGSKEQQAQFSPAAGEGAKAQGGRSFRVGTQFAGRVSRTPGQVSPQQQRV